MDILLLYLQKMYINDEVPDVFLMFNRSMLMYIWTDQESPSDIHYSMIMSNSNSTLVYGEN